MLQYIMSIKTLPPAARQSLLDDTGRDTLDIFEHPDLQALQIQPFPAYWDSK